MDRRSIQGMHGELIALTVGDAIKCIKPHEDGNFTKGKTYKVNAFSFVACTYGVRVRDDRRQRKDFNFLSSSKNYFWNHFRLL